MHSLSSQRAAQIILDSLPAPHQQQQQHRQQALAVNPCHAWPRMDLVRRAATSHQPAAAVWTSTAPEALPRGRRAPKNARPVPRAALYDAGERSCTCCKWRQVPHSTATSCLAACAKHLSTSMLHQGLHIKSGLVMGMKIALTPASPFFDQCITLLGLPVIYLLSLDDTTGHESDHPKLHITKWRAP